MRYHEELCRAMTMLADAGVHFYGQAVAADGTAMRTTLKHLPPEVLHEFPVAENMNLGFCTGIAIAGGKPCMVLPRINFLLEATSQLVLHLDKIALYSDGGYRPKVIIRTAIATDKPLDPGPQHLGDYVGAFKLMLKTVEVVRLNRPKDIFDAYHWAAHWATGSTMLVEHLSMYDEGT